MDLKEFIGQALSDLVEGVANAQSSLGANGAHINPQLSHGDARAYGGLVSGSGHPVQLVEFDVAVSASEAKGVKGSIGIVVGTVGFGSWAKALSKNSAVSRIKFSVPVSLPNAQPKSG